MSCHVLLCLCGSLQVPPSLKDKLVRLKLLLLTQTDGDSFLLYFLKVWLKSAVCVVHYNVDSHCVSLQSWLGFPPSLLDGCYHKIY